MKGFTATILKGGARWIMVGIGDHRLVRKGGSSAHGNEGGVCVNVSLYPTQG